MADQRIHNTSIIPWSSPIPSFGDLYTADVATVGLNPSNREFVDASGKELDGMQRRFHTLKSLGISKWSDAESSHKDLILDLCKNYFTRNPYDWFKKMDYVISGTNRSYYFPSGRACHLDLIPYATMNKWADLSIKERTLLLEISGDTLGVLLRASPIQVLVLNGITVVENLKKISDVNFDIKKMQGWTLPRISGEGVLGYSYKGLLSNIAGLRLNRKVLVLGYNHNIQSSFGVTTKVLQAIRKWIAINANIK